MCPVKELATTPVDAEEEPHANASRRIAAIAFQILTLDLAAAPSNWSVHAIVLVAVQAFALQQQSA